MIFDYNLVESLTEEEFKKLTADPLTLTDPKKYTKSDAEDVARIERLLDVEQGVLTREPFYFQVTTCEGCGRNLTMYDFIFTAIVDANHPKSFILHTLLGNKYVVNKARRVRCSDCGVTTQGTSNYGMAKYGCTHTEQL